MFILFHNCVMKKDTWHCLVVLFLNALLSCEPPSNHVHILVYVLEECQISLLPFRSGVSAHSSHLPDSHTHRANALPRFLVLCTDFSCRTPYVTCSLVSGKSESKGFILVFPVRDTQQGFNVWREFGHRNLNRFQSSPLNQISLLSVWQFYKQKS